MDAPSCIVCGKEAHRLCSACKTTHYCCKDHQVAHWKVHKSSCCGKTYRMEGNANSGHYLVAQKDLTAGMIILQENPFMMGPKLRNNEDIRVCLGCYKKLGGQGGRGVDCPSCRWQMCGKKECWEEGSDHANGECSLLKGARERIPANFLNVWKPHHVYHSISIIRCLALRERDPVKWEELMKMKNCLSSNKLSVCKSTFRLNVVPIINQWLLASPVPEEWIFNVDIAISFKSLPVNLPTGQSDFVYTLGTLFDHSCIPNAEHTFTLNGKMLVRSTVPIAKGSKVTLNYAKKPLLGTLERYKLLETTQFLGSCDCERCKDPTELKTFTSGIFCTKCPDQEGILLPEYPLDKESNWICTKCSSRKPCSFVTKLLEEDVIHLDDQDLKNTTKCEAFMRKYEKILHPNHYLLTGIRMHYCISSLLTADKECIRDVPDDDELDKRETEAMKLLELANIVSPGLTHLRRKILFNLAVMEYTRIRKDIKERNFVTLPNSENHPRLEALTQNLNEICTISSWCKEKTLDDGMGSVKCAQEMLSCIPAIKKCYLIYKNKGNSNNV